MFKKRLGIAVIPPIDLEPYLRLLYRNVASKGIDVFDSTWMASSLKLLFLRRRISIVHVHWLEHYFKSPNPIVTACASLVFIFQFVFFKIIGLKTMVTLHNVVPHERVFPRVEHMIFAWTLHFSDGVIVHNDYSKRYAEEVYKIDARKIFVIPHGNFINYYPDDNMSSEEAKKTLGILPDRLVLLFFGIIRPHKGIDLLISSFEEAVGKSPQLFLLIAGKCLDVRLRTELIRFQDRFPKNCKIIMNHIPDNEVSALMRAADVGMLPYRKVTTSGAALLFMSYGLPLIASDLPAMRETLGNTSTTYFGSDDSKSLEDAMLVASRKAKLSDSDQKKILESARLLDWSKIADATIAAYYHLISHPHARLQRSLTVVPCAR
jgi:glycosyltransferase involved in cell wall biosynthesis